MAGHGGARVGAGRKPGQASRKTREIANGALRAGISPLEFLLQVMRDSSAPLTLRCEMAVAAMSYCHARVSTQVLPPEPEPRTTVINVCSFPSGSQFDPRTGTIRLPPPAPVGDIVDLEPEPEPAGRKPN
jgi:hypothetical protein